MATLGELLNNAIVNTFVSLIVNAPSSPQAVSISSSTTYIYYTNVAGNFTVNVSIAGGYTQALGDIIFLFIDNDSTPRTVTFGTLIKTDAATLVGTASKKAIVVFVSDGNNFNELIRKTALPL